MAYPKHGQPVRQRSTENQHSISTVPSAATAGHGGILMGVPIIPAIRPVKASGVIFVTAPCIPAVMNRRENGWNAKMAEESGLAKDAHLSIHRQLLIT